MVGVSIDFKINYMLKIMVNLKRRIPKHRYAWKSGLDRLKLKKKILESRRYAGIIGSGPYDNFIKKL
jgi:hypothetical protein